MRSIDGLLSPHPNPLPTSRGEGVFLCPIARKQETKRFFELADRLAHSRNPEEQKRLKDELARMAFSE